MFILYYHPYFINTWSIMYKRLFHFLMLNKNTNRENSRFWNFFCRNFYSWSKYLLLFNFFCLYNSKRRPTKYPKNKEFFFFFCLQTKIVLFNLCSSLVMFSNNLIFKDPKKKSFMNINNDNSM